MWEELPEPIHYEMVDLGLPSGLKWADRNVGAATPEAFGDYFAWGETAPRGEDWATEAPYDWAHAPFNGGKSDYDTTEFEKVSGDVCPGEVLASAYDAAHVIMGGTWRMPTSAEMQELIDGTTQSVEELNGVMGMCFTAPNGNSIFMPFAGMRYDSDVSEEGSYCGVWSSSLIADYVGCSHCLDFTKKNGYAGVYSDIRYVGFAVRGVC